MIANVRIGWAPNVQDKLKYIIGCMYIHLYIHACVDSTYGKGIFEKQKNFNKSYKHNRLEFEKCLSDSNFMIVLFFNVNKNE